LICANTIRRAKYPDVCVYKSLRHPANRLDILRIAAASCKSLRRSANRYYVFSNRCGILQIVAALCKSCLRPVNRDWNVQTVTGPGNS
jgi:hypothetical protein